MQIHATLRERLPAHVISEHHMYFTSSFPLLQLALPFDTIFWSSQQYMSVLLCERREKRRRTTWGATSGGNGRPALCYYYLI